MGGVELQPWYEMAACAAPEVDPRWFYPEKGYMTMEARRVCVKCPVKVECLNYALRKPERHGVWGGMSADDRHELLRAYRRMRRQAS